ncbi:MAG: hypothetical protein ACI9H6_000245 [Patiriisocius sp.]|jgi:hypothetical protein
MYGKVKRRRNTDEETIDHTPTTGNSQQYHASHVYDDTVQRVEFRGLVRDYQDNCVILLAFGEQTPLGPGAYAGETLYASEEQLMDAIDTESCTMKNEPENKGGPPVALS